jgi:hypothetical protein
MSHNAAVFTDRLTKALTGGQSGAMVTRDCGSKKCSTYAKILPAFLQAIV